MPLQLCMAVQLLQSYSIGFPGKLEGISLPYTPENPNFNMLSVEMA